MLKIYKVTFNDGGWYTGDMPNFYTIAETNLGAIENVLIEHPRFRNGYDHWATEFVMPGYIIEVYDEKTYNHEKNLEKLI